VSLSAAHTSGGRANSSTRCVIDSGKADDLIDLDHRVMSPVHQMGEWEPLVIASGDGNYLVDATAAANLDGVSSLWCNVHGHATATRSRAHAEQAERIAHSTFPRPDARASIASAPRSSRSRPRLSSRVLSVLGPTASRSRSAVVTSTGSSGPRVEAALPAAGDAYHGDTLGAVGVGGIDLSIACSRAARAQHRESVPSGHRRAASIDAGSARSRRTRTKSPALCSSRLVQGGSRDARAPARLPRARGRAVRAHACT